MTVYAFAGDMFSEEEDLTSALLSSRLKFGGA